MRRGRRGGAGGGKHAFKTEQDEHNPNVSSSNLFIGQTCTKPHGNIDKGHKSDGRDGAVLVHSVPATAAVVLAHSQAFLLEQEYGLAATPPAVVVPAHAAHDEPALAAAAAAAAACARVSAASLRACWGWALEGRCTLPCHPPPPWSSSSTAASRAATTL
jgi:hypothetical protein